MRPKFKKQIVISVLIIALLSIPFGIWVYKPDIDQATYQELIEIDDIGDVLSNRILSYVKEHENCTVDDLINIKGIGIERIKAIKQKYK